MTISVYRFILQFLPALCLVFLPVLLLADQPQGQEGRLGNAGNPHAGEPIATVREVYDGRMLPDIAVNTFRNIDRLFPVRTVKRGDRVSPMPLALQSLDDFTLHWNDRTYDLFDVLSLNRVSGILILQDGAIVYEQYLLGNTAQTRWMSMSVVKSITAMLIGAAVQEGHIRSLDDAVTDYLPELEGSAYEGVTVRQLLLMATGVQWNEAYTDPASDRRALLEAHIALQPGKMMEVMAALPRVAEPGSRWNYSTGEPYIAGALLRAATGQWLADYLSQTLWQPLGMQADANWWLEAPGGLEMGGSGLSATLRDYARFGQFLLADGVIDGRRVLPEGWMAEASARTVIGGQEVEYGYTLWPLHGNSYAAIGIFGQYVFVDPANRLVVAMWSAQSKPVDKHGVDEYVFLEALSAYFAVKDVVPNAGGAPTEPGSAH